VYVYDKKEDNIFDTNIRNIASEKGFYNIYGPGVILSIEPSLKLIETSASQIIKEIIGIQSLERLNESKKASLSIFFAAQISRVKQARLTILEMNVKLKEKIQQMGFNPNDVKGMHNLKEEEIKNRSILGLWDSVKEYAPYLYNKAWILHKAPKGSSYYISDNPITLQNMIDYGPYGNLGLAVVGIEIYFPISKELSLGMICYSWLEKILLAIQHHQNDGSLSNQKRIQSLRKLKHAFISGEVHLSEEENVINKNSLQVINSSRFVYSSDGNFDLLKQMISENPDFREPPKIKVN
jgi:hypothetical protein